MDTVLSSLIKPGAQARYVGWFAVLMYAAMVAYLCVSVSKYPGVGEVVPGVIPTTKSIAGLVGTLVTVLFLLPYIVLFYGMQYGDTPATQKETSGVGALIIFISLLILTMLMLMLSTAVFIESMSAHLDDIIVPIVSVPGIEFPRINLIPLPIASMALIASIATFYFSLRLLRRSSFGRFSVSGVCGFMFIHLAVFYFIYHAFFYLFPADTFKNEVLSDISSYTSTLISGAGFGETVMDARHIKESLISDVFELQVGFFMVSLFIYGLLITALVKRHPHSVKLSDCIAASISLVVMIAALTPPKIAFLNEVMERSESRFTYITQRVSSDCTNVKLDPYCWTVGVLTKNQLPLTESNVQLLSGLNGQLLSINEVRSSVVVYVDDLINQKPMPALANWMARSYRNSLRHAAVQKFNSTKELNADKYARLSTLKWIEMAISAPFEFATAWNQGEEPKDSTLLAIQIAILGRWDISFVDTVEKGKQGLSKNGALYFYVKKDDINSISLHDDGRFSIESIEAILKIKDEDLPSFKNK